MRGVDRAALIYVGIVLSLATLAAAAVAALSGLDSTAHVTLTGMFVMAVPALVAIVFVKLVHREALTDYGLGWRAGLGGFRMLGLAFVTPLAITVPLLLLGYFVMGLPVRADLDATKLAAVVLINIPLSVAIGSFTFGLGEELGWRGYLLRRLGRSMSWRRASLAIGVVWAVYHLPLILLSPTGKAPLVVACSYSAAVVGLSVIHTWFALRAKRGSVIVPSALHIAFNAWTQTLVGEAAFGLPGLLQQDPDYTWIIALEGIAGAVLCLALAVPFYFALARMDRAGAGFEPARPRAAAAFE